MQHRFTEFPEVPWKAGWCLRSGPNDPTPFATADACGSISIPGTDARLTLCDPSIPFSIHLFSSALCMHTGRQAAKSVCLFAMEPGILCGISSHLPPPILEGAPQSATEQGDACWFQQDHRTVLLLRRDHRFALVLCEGLSTERAFAEAERALETDLALQVDSLMQSRGQIVDLFCVNPRHNPPVALAAEQLELRLRAAEGPLHGIWSVAEGFEEETFSLNELYPLTHAWRLIRPETAMDLVLTALRLQRPDGGFPAWASATNRRAATAPWPFIAQSFEQAWSHAAEPQLLVRLLPALRKYIQWALRYYDPHRDGIPSWQSELEVFVPGTFARDKATPDLTTFLIAEIDAVLRLYEKSEATSGVTFLVDERARLFKTLNDLFWNIDERAFSFVWQNGHFLHEPSFGSFLPLSLTGLDATKQAALLEALEETHGFPGQPIPATWKNDKLSDTGHLPAIHQFMAFDILRQAEPARPILQLFLHRAREGFIAWFERESLDATRSTAHPKQPNQPAYALGPVTSALILTVQNRFREETEQAPSAMQLLLRGARKLRINRTDIRIIAFFIVAILGIRLAYNLPQAHRTRTQMAEAALYYQQGRFSEVLAICRQHPAHPQARLLLAHLYLLAEDPGDAIPLYRQILLEYPGSPSALAGMALALQMNRQFDEAAQRYTDFIDIHGERLPVLARFAADFRTLALEGFARPPRRQAVLRHPVMHDLSY